MIIPIDDKQRIRSDENQWIVERLVGKKKQVWRAETFHTEAHDAIRKCCNRDIRLIDDNKEVADAIIDVQEILDRYIGILEMMPKGD